MSSRTPANPIGRARRSVAAVAALVGVLALTTGVADAAEVQNGSFETGDLTGWTTADMGAGSWDVLLAGDDINYDPPCDTYAVYSDQGDPTAMVLYQDIALEAEMTHTLSFQHSWVNFADGEIPPEGQPDAESVFITPPNLTDDPNQQYRVDIMDPAADPYSTADADVLQAVFRTNVGDPDLSGGWLPVNVDLSPWAGQTVRLRFAIAVTAAPIQAGIDCVAVQSTPLQTTTTTAPPTTSTQAAAAVVTPAFTG